MESHQAIKFPFYYLQSDWNESLSRSNEKIWMSSANINESETKKNYNLKVVNNSIVTEEKVEDFKINSCTNTCFVLQDDKSKVNHRFIPQIKVFSSVHAKAVVSLDVATNGLAVSASSDGSMKVWDTYSGVIKHELKGHFLGVNKCRFFPSNEVILSAGADMQIKIWSAINGLCPAALLGHKAAVNDTAIVDRGRNIISVGRDGFAKLWSCAKQSCIEDLFDISTETNPSINACAIRSIEEIDLGERTSALSPDAVGTLDKLMIIGTEAGSVYGIGVNSQQAIFKVNCKSPVNQVVFLKEHNFAYGTQEGLVYESDLRNPGRPLYFWNYSHSPVLSLLSVRRPFDGLVIGRGDGSVNFVYENHQEVVHLTGSDCDPIYHIAYDNKFIYTACRDGKVRKYLLNQAFE